MKKGIRNKVRKSFITLGIILFFAGISSYLELVNLSKSSRNVIDLGAKSILMSATLLDFVYLHNNLYSEYYHNKDNEYMRHQSEIILQRMDSVVNNALHNNGASELLDPVINSVAQYKKDAREYYPLAILDDENWYYHFQSDAYFNFVKGMKEYILFSQGFVVQETTSIYSGIYRSVMLGIVSLLFVLIILLMFFVLLDIYYLKPVVKLTKSLDQYLSSGTPFVVKVDGKDEVYKLKELILDLISANRSSKKNNNNIFNQD